MNYKWFFIRVWRLIISPVKTWEEIAKEDETENKNFFGDYFYPLIGFCGMALFGFSLLYKWLHDPNVPVNLIVQNALMDTAEIFFAFVGGYFLSIWAVRQLSERLLNVYIDDKWLTLLIGYSMTVPIILQTIAGIFSSFVLLQWIFQFYTLYLVWEGSKKIESVKEDNRLTFSILTALLLIALPNLIGLAFGGLTFILH